MKTIKSINLNKIHIKLLLVLLSMIFSINSYGDCLTSSQFDSLVTKGVEIMKVGELNVEQMVFLVKIRNTMGEANNDTNVNSEFNKCFNDVEDKIIEKLKFKIVGGYLYSKENDLYLGVNVYRMRERDMFWVKGKTC